MVGWNQYVFFHSTRPELKQEHGRVARMPPKLSPKNSEAYGRGHEISDGKKKIRLAVPCYMRGERDHIARV